MEYAYLYLLVIIVPIFIAYYYDYRRNKTDFKRTILKIGKVIIFILIIIGLKKTYKKYIPLNKNHGIEFNEIRKVAGIPIIQKKWSNINSDQFRKTYWIDEENGHFKKILDYNFKDITEESDYYKSKIGTVLKKYNYETKTYEYFKETSSANNNIENETIEKSVFENSLKGKENY